jgi:hypothetical protein
LTANAVSTRIDEPGGWDGFTLKIKRHAERHGTFREVQSTEFKFYDVARVMLKAENEHIRRPRVTTICKIDGKCGWRMG